VIVRAATFSDIAALADIGVAGYRLGFGDIIGQAGLAIFDRDYFSGRFAREWPAIAVAEKGSMVRGFAEVRDGTLDMLFVAPSAARQGVGGLLLADAEKRGAVRLECFRDNVGARTFYEKHDWRVTRAYSRQFASVEHAFVTYEKSVTASA
jgi:GNAT superfamily N-acetyltransferase